MSVSLAPIKPLLRVQDICELLGIARSKFYELKDEGWFGGEGPALTEVQPPLDRSPRYLGEPFAAWLSAREQMKRRARLSLHVSRVGS